MFGFLTPVGNEAIDPLTDVATVESFWRKLPRNDPAAMQKAVCAALAEPVARNSLDTDRLRALLLLDTRARALVDALLVSNAGADPEAFSNEAQRWQSAFDLCWSFGRAYGQVMRSMSDSRGSQSWRQYEPQVFLRLLQHRQAELMLRPFVDERSTRFSWKELHAVYRFAKSRDLLHDDLPINRSGSPVAAETTLEREYAHALLQELINGGHFPPHDAFWINDGIPRWCRGMTLKSAQPQSGKNGFVVDPYGDAGLVRSDGGSADTYLRFDMRSVLSSIRDEIARLRETPFRPSEGAAPGRARRLVVLSKLDALCALERPIIARRGEREPTAASVEVIVGMARIMRTLRRADEVVAGAPRIAARGDDVTITQFGGTIEGSTSSQGASTVTQSSTSSAGMAPALLTMADRSDSGCRLQGPTLATTRIPPGALIAFREDAASPWTLAVVRRVRKRLAGKRIEIGAEYLGKDPRVVVVVQDSDTGPDKSPDGKAPRFAALYLSESVERPALPMKTLILPARGISPGGRLSVRSRTSAHTIQLKEPLEEQADFIWSPFEILEVWLKDAPAADAAKSPTQ